MKYLILGNGPAGVVAAETLRRNDPVGEIVMVGSEGLPPYSRMAIPYFLEGNIGEPGMYLRKTADHFAQLRITERNGRAVGLDTAARLVRYADGTTESYDKLLIATGSRPVNPPIPGLDRPQVQNCWTMTDARAIAALTKPGSRVLQLGAGFIGCIIMEALATRGVQLTVVEMGDRMVPRMMGPAAGGMIKRWVEGKGVHVHTGARVEAIERPGPENAAMGVRLSSGQVLPADLVISATGVRPNIGFLEHSGVRCLVGVLTDERMQTNVPGVYAAGDCAEAFDKVSGQTIVSAIQPNAAEQARVAAMNMLGRDTSLKGVTQINVLDTLGLISASFGQWQGVPGGEQVQVTDEPACRHLSLQFAGDRLVGCNAVGWTQHVGVMRGLVEGQVRLGAWKDKLLADPTLLMEAYLASAQAQGERGHLTA